MIELAEIIWAFEGARRYDVLIGTKEGNMPWRGRVKSGVAVPEQGASRKEDSEVLIEASPLNEEDHELALTELKTKLERASDNAGKGEFFTPDQVLGQIAEFRSDA